MDDFRKKILKVNSPRHHEIKNSIGVYDIYKYIRKNKWFDIGQSITEHQFYTIVRTINKFLVQELLSGRDIKLPYRMGSILIRKYKPIIKYRDDKLIVTLPIDWDKTLSLWQEDEECLLNKTLVRTDSREVFTIKYYKNKANYNNQLFYEFRPNRTLKRLLKDKILNDNFDTFLCDE